MKTIVTRVEDTMGDLDFIRTLERPELYDIQDVKSRKIVAVLRICCGKIKVHPWIEESSEIDFDTVIYSSELPETFREKFIKFKDWFRWKKHGVDVGGLGEWLRTNYLDCFHNEQERGIYFLEATEAIHKYYEQKSL